MNLTDALPSSPGADFLASYDELQRVILNADRNLAAVSFVDVVAADHGELLDGWCRFLPICCFTPSLNLVRATAYLSGMVVAEAIKVAYFVCRRESDRTAAALTVGGDASMSVIRRMTCSEKPFENMTCYGHLRGYVATCARAAASDNWRAHASQPAPVEECRSDAVVRGAYVPHKRYTRKPDAARGELPDLYDTEFVHLLYARDDDR